MFNLPVITGSYYMLSSARAIAVSGDLAFVADYTSGLRVIDITDRTKRYREDGKAEEIWEPMNELYWR